MTLSTCADDLPWSAPVYYLFHKEKFYFFSSPESKHILQTQQNNRAAASIFASSDDWQSIRGIQMPGKIARVQKTRPALSVITRYLARYPFTKDFFLAAGPVTLESFKINFNACLYCFIPDHLLYLDNKTHFGSREKILL